MLPTYAIANIIGCSDEKLANYSTQEALSLFRNKADENSWHPDRLRAAKSAIIDLFEYLDSRDRDHQGRAIAADVSLHLIAFRDASVSTLRTRRDDRLAKGKQVKNHYGGKMSGQSKFAALKWSQRWLKCDFDMTNVSLARAPDFADCRRLPKAALPYTPYMLAKLEAFCEDSSKPLHQRFTAAAMLFCVWCCLRMAQAQDCFVTHILSGEYIEGMVTKDKNPNPTKMRMKPFFGLVRGLTSRQWFDLWISTIRDSGCEECRCVFPDYKLENDGSLTWLGAPMETIRLISTTQDVLVASQAVSDNREACLFGLHSPRHTLPFVAKARFESALDRQEIGRWGNSIASMDVMRPLSGIIMRHVAQSSELPDRYAQCPQVQHVHNILMRQANALRAYTAACGGLNKLPKSEAWDRFPPFLASESSDQTQVLDILRL
jgi:hypothetical protein